MNRGARGLLAVFTLLASLARADDVMNPSMDPDSIRGRKAKKYGLDRAASGRHAEAEKLYGECIEAYGRAQDRVEVAWCHCYRGQLLQKLGRMDDAFADFDASAKIYRELIPGAKHPDDLQNYLSANLQGRHTILSERGEHEAASRTAEEWLEVERAIRKRRPSPGYAEGEARASSAMAVSLSALGDHFNAARYYERAAALWEHAGKSPGNDEWRARADTAIAEARARAEAERKASAAALAAVSAAKPASTPTAAVPAGDPGLLTANGKSVALRHAYLFSAPDQWRKNSLLYLVLRDRPLRPEEIAAADSPGAFAAANSLLFELKDDERYQLTISAESLDRQLHESGLIKQSLRFDELRPDRAKGVAKGESTFFPGDPTDDVAYDVPFDVTLARAFAPRPRSDSEGATAANPPVVREAGEAYLATCKSLPKTIEDFEKQLEDEGKLPTDEQVAELSKRTGRELTRREIVERLFTRVQALSALEPQECVVLGGEERGDDVVLDIEATTMGARSRAPVTMTKKDGAWTVKETGTWTGAPVKSGDRSHR